MFSDKRKRVVYVDEKFLHDTGVLLTKVSKATIHNYKKFSKVAVEDEDISVCGLEILTSLRYYPDKNTVSDLAQNMEVSKGVVSRNVEILRKSGYLNTYQDETDRRILRISINSEKALPILLKQKKNLFSLIYQMADDLTDEQLIQFNDTLKIVFENCKNASLDKETKLPEIDYEKFVF